MIMKKIVWFIVLSTVFTVILGITDYYCDTERPWQSSDATCKCITSNNIYWKSNTVTFSTCTTGGLCSPKPAGYVFQTNTSNPDKEYGLTVQNFDYSRCAVFSCTDITTSQEKNVSLVIAAFDATSPSGFVEPGNNQDGNIEITTACLFKESDITVEWFYVKKNSVIEVPYTPGADFQTSTNCTDSCNGEAAVRLNIGFAHTENGAQTVNFGLRVYHKENTTNVLKIQTSSEYNITATTGAQTTGKTGGLSTGAIVGIVIGSVVSVIIIVVVILAIMGKLPGNKPGRYHPTNNSHGDKPSNKK